MIRTQPIRDTTGYALAKVCKAHRANVADTLAEVGLHPGQQFLLMELWEQDGLRGGELAARLNVEPPTVTKMLRRMEACGLVERRQDQDDARSCRVHLTEAGRALQEPVTSRWREAEEKTLSGMSREEQRTLHGLLEKMRGNLDPGFDAR